MARMTKPQRQVLESSMYDLHRFLDWIKSEQVEVHRAGFGPIFKDAGSPIQFVENTLDRITNLHAKQFN